MGKVRRALMRAIWSQIEVLLPVPVDSHPLGCHRPRVPDRVVFDRLVHRLLTGCSDDNAAIPGCSATTLRTRRDEWIAAGVFTALWYVTLAAYDRIVGLVLDDRSIDGCIAKAPCGGALSGKSPVDRGKQGRKRSILVDGRGIPVAWAVTGANRPDSQLVEATVAHLAVTCAALDVTVPDLASVHADKGYDIRAVRARLDAWGFDCRIAEKATGNRTRSRQRWVVERANAHHNQHRLLTTWTSRATPVIDAEMHLASTLVVAKRLLRVARLYQLPEPDQ